MVLNGQGKSREADELRERIRKLWEKDYKAEWIAKGSPVGESSWARVVGSSKDYDVFGVEYFVPRLLEGADRKDPNSDFICDSVYLLWLSPPSEITTMAFLR